MRALGLLACAPLASCHLVFELNDPGPADGEVTPDTVEGQFVVRTVIPNAGFENEIFALPPPSSIMVRIDGAQQLTEVPVRPDGGFEFTRAEPDYVIETAAQGAVFEITESSAELTIGADFAGRFDAEPVTQATQVFLPAPLTTSRVLATAGQFTSTTVLGTVVDWRDTTATGGVAQGLLDSAKHDQVFLLEYTNGHFAGGQTAISHSGKLSPPFAMVDGQPFDVSLVEVNEATAPSGCVHVTANLEPMVQRLKNAAPPPDDGALSRSWVVAALPAQEIGLLGHNNLVGAGFASTDPFAVDVDVPYFDPFTDHDLVVVGAASVETTVTVPGAIDNRSIFAGFTIVAEAPRGACPAVELASEAAFAIKPALDGVPLISNGQDVTIQRPGTAILTWETDGGTADFFEVQLHEVTATNSRVSLELLRMFRTRTPQVGIPEALLRPDHTYILTLGLRTGYPAAAGGDYVTFGPTVTLTNTHSVTFVAH